MTLVTAQAHGAVRTNAENRQSRGIVFVNQGEFLRIANQFSVKLRTIKISKRDLAKLASSVPKGCGCAPSEEMGSGWQCFKDCLAEAQVSYATAVACAAACGVSLVACAICVGIAETIVEGCSLGCAWRPLFSKNVQHKTRLIAQVRRSETHRANLARLSLSPSH